MHYMFTDFNGDSSSCFPFRAQTNATERSTHAGGYTAGVRNKQLYYWQTWKHNILLSMSVKQWQTPLGFY